MTDTFLGHPKGLVVCFLTELWERFAYYGMLSLLILYVTKTYLLADAAGNRLVAAYGALIWMSPVIGGVIADRWLGSRKSVVIGALFMAIGFLSISFPEFISATFGLGESINGVPPLDALFFSMAIIITGIGFLKSNIATVVGSLYPINDRRRESGFTIFYWGINLGGAAGPIICGGIAHAYGTRIGFSVAGVGMLFALVTFLYGHRYIGEHTNPPDPARLRRKILPFISVEHAIYIGGFIGIIGLWQLMRFHHLVPNVLLWFGAALGLYVIYFSLRNCNKVERDRMLIVLLLLVFTIVFASLNMQMFGSLILFGDRYVDRVVFGTEIAASQLQSIPALVVICFAPLLNYLWIRLDRMGKNPNIPVKFSLGLLLNGIAFFMPALALWLLGSDDLVPLIWLALVFIIMTIGEICIFPIAMSMISTLCPKRVIAMMMGVFYFTLALGSILGGELAARYTTVETADGAQASFEAGLSAYVLAFSIFGGLALVVGTILMVLSPVLHKRMNLEST